MMGAYPAQFGVLSDKLFVSDIIGRLIRFAALAPVPPS